MPKEPRQPRIKKDLILDMRAMPLKGYIIRANVGFFPGLLSRVAAVTTKEEVKQTVLDLINMHLQ
jgi:hypothetical protein